MMRLGIVGIHDDLVFLLGDAPLDDLRGIDPVVRGNRMDLQRSFIPFDMLRCVHSVPCFDTLDAFHSA
ncbi:hypothetical protein D1872_272460 [compost metagenome]